MAGKVGVCASCSSYGALEFRLDPEVKQYRWICDACSSPVSSIKPKRIDARQVDLLRTEHERRVSSGRFRAAAPAPESLVLVVEDDPDLQATIGQILEHDGYTTARASTGQQALGLLRSAPPDIILLDLMLPVMNGWEFIERADREHLLGLTPVLVMTAFPEEAEPGRFRVLRKPMSFDTLLDAVHSATVAPP